MASWIVWLYFFLLYPHNMNKRESAIYEFLKHVNVISDEKHYNKLDGVEVLRDIFLSNEKV